MSGRRNAHPLAAACALEGAPDDHDVLSERLAHVLGREVGKCGEVTLLISPADGGPSLTAQAERMCFEEAVLDEGVEDCVVVSCRFGVAMPLEEALHLLRAHPT